MKKIFVALFALLAISQVSYAQWSTGSGYIYPTTLTDKLGLGLTTPVTPLHVVKTTEQLRLGYNDTNYGSFTTSSAGNLALTSTGGLVSTPVRFSIGSSSSSGATNLSVNKDITGSTSSYGTFVTGTIQSDVTTKAILYGTSLSTQAVAFTIGNIMHYSASQSSFGAGSSVLNQFGFYVNGSLIGANKNYAFYGGIPAATNRWNIYMNGTANNYLAGSLGLGTDNPVAKLHLYGNMSKSTWAVTGAYFAVGSNTVTDTSAASGTVVAYNTLSSFGAATVAAANSSVTYSKAATVYIAGAPIAGTNVTLTTPMALYIKSGNSVFLDKVGIGTHSPDESLTVNGKIHAKEVRIDTSIPTPDYVFNKDYDLLSLADVKNYIDKNHHLPEVPSAAEVEKNGLKLGEMNLILLKKVEELTLHLIEKDEQLKSQLEVVTDLKTKQKNLENKLEQLLNQSKK